MIFWGLKSSCMPQKVQTAGRGDGEEDEMQGSNEKELRKCAEGNFIELKTWKGP